MNAVDVALMTKLAAVNGVTGGVHQVLRPQTDAAWPVVVFSLLGGTDEESYSGNGPQILDYDVKVIAPIESQGGVGAVVEAVHAALHRKSLTISGMTHMRTLRLRRLPTYPDASSGRVFIHRGATYRIWVT